MSLQGKAPTQGTYLPGRSQLPKRAKTFRVVNLTLGFIEREMLDEESGGVYTLRMDSKALLEALWSHIRLLQAAPYRPIPVELTLKDDETGELHWIHENENEKEED